jgi:hypothetical protein
VLTAGAGVRLFWATVVVGLMWLAVVWALS